MLISLFLKKNTHNEEVINSIALPIIFLLCEFSIFFFFLHKIHNVFRSTNISRKKKKREKEREKRKRKEKKELARCAFTCKQ